MDFTGVRLIGLDLDETVFTHDKRITPRTRAAIMKTIQAGIHVLPATGRPLAGIPEQFTEIPGVRYALGSNGAIVADLISGQILVHECMDRETVLRVLDAVRSLNCITELYLDGTPYSERDRLEQADYYFPDPHIRAYVRKTRIPVEDIREFFVRSEKGVEKINLSFPTVQEKEVGEQVLRRIPKASCVQGLPTNLELSREDVDKGSGLLRLADVLKIPHSAVLGCGDSGNDLAMIKRCGIGVAMANASEEVREAADYVLPFTNEEEGVAWLLEQIIGSAPPKK